MRWPAGFSGGKVCQSQTQSHGFGRRAFCRTVFELGRALPVAPPFRQRAPIASSFVPDVLLPRFARIIPVSSFSPYNWLRTILQLPGGAVCDSFMLRLPKIRLLLALATLLATLMPAWLVAQDDPNDLPLGDVARTLRKKTPLSQDVIDDDNLTKVMEQAESRHATARR